jgi:hypothetical protein
MFWGPNISDHSHAIIRLHYSTVACLNEQEHFVTRHDLAGELVLSIS